MIQRKIMVASLISPLVAFFFTMNAMMGESAKFKTVVPDFFATNSVFLFIVFLLISTYGAMTSLFADAITTYRSQGEMSFTQHLISFCIHLLFGLLLKLYSLIPAVLFYLVDRLLMKWHSSYSNKAMIRCLMIPIGIWFLGMVITYTFGVFGNWKDYLVF